MAIQKKSFSEKKIRVLDIGSAVGTTAWALYDFYDILNHVLKLYGLKGDKLPPLIIDSLEKYSTNIEFFNVIKNKVDLSNSNVVINAPIEGDVLNGGLDKVKLKSYDIVIASNILNEFPNPSILFLSPAIF